MMVRANGRQSGEHHAGQRGRDGLVHHGRCIQALQRKDGQQTGHEDGPPADTQQPREHPCNGTHE